MVQGRLCLTSNLRGGFPSYDLVTMRSTWHTYLEGEDVMVGSVVLIKATLLIVLCSLTLRLTRLSLKCSAWKSFIPCLKSLFPKEDPTFQILAS